MSLSGALNSSVSALKAQSTAIATVSDNLANSSTYGYKTTVASFEAWSPAPRPRPIRPAACSRNTRSNIARRASSPAPATTPTSRSRATASSRSPAPPARTRSSTPATASSRRTRRLPRQQRLLPAGLAHRCRRQRHRRAHRRQSREHRHQRHQPSCAAPTTEVSMSANLPANAAVGDTSRDHVEVYDSLGRRYAPHREKTGIGTWEATFSNPVLSSDGTTVVGTSTGDADRAHLQ